MQDMALNRHLGGCTSLGGFRRATPALSSSALTLPLGADEASLEAVRSTTCSLGGCSLLSRPRMVACSAAS